MLKIFSRQFLWLLSFSSFLNLLFLGLLCFFQSCPCQSLDRLIKSLADFCLLLNLSRFCPLFSYQGSFFCLATARLVYHISSLLSSTFLFLFFRLTFRLSSSFILTQALLFVNNFFILFFASLFPNAATCSFYHMSCSLSITFFIFFLHTILLCSVLRCCPPFSAGENYNNTTFSFCQHFFCIFIFLFTQK